MFNPLNPFDPFFSDPVYLEFKNHLFNYLTRCRAIRSVARSYNGKSLEIGSGISPVTEASVYTDLSHAAMKQLGKGNCLVTDACRLAFRPASFDHVILSEVLEHIQDDGKVLSEIAGVLKPGGTMILTVPLHSYYFAFDDRYVGHERRYSIPDLAKKLEVAGFTILHRKKVGGPLERFGTWLTVRIFAALKVGARPAVPLRIQKFLPAYKAINHLLSRLVEFDAWLMPEFLSSIILLECRLGGPGMINYN